MRTGIDYSVIRPVMWALQISRKRWTDTLDRLRIMEIAALEALNADLDK